MAPGKKSDVEAVVENLREEVSKIGTMESTMEDLKGTVTEIRNRMSILERLEQRLNVDDETRKVSLPLCFKRRCDTTRRKRSRIPSSDRENRSLQRKNVAVSFVLEDRDRDRRQLREAGTEEVTH